MAPGQEGQEGTYLQGIPWMKMVFFMSSLPLTQGPHLKSPPQECPVATSSHAGPTHEVQSQWPMITKDLLYIVTLSQNKSHHVTDT